MGFPLPPPPPPPFFFFFFTSSELYFKSITFSFFVAVVLQKSFSLNRLRILSKTSASGQSFRFPSSSVFVFVFSLLFFSSVPSVSSVSDHSFFFQFRLTVSTRPQKRTNVFQITPQPTPKVNKYGALRHRNHKAYWGRGEGEKGVWMWRKREIIYTYRYTLSLPE